MARQLHFVNSILSNRKNMGSPFFQEMKKQTSFFFKEKIIKTARLALTDVTPVELMAEDATDGNMWPPDTRILGVISRAAFEVDDYWRVVEILHKRLSNFERKNWRGPYKALILLEHLLTHGPLRVAEEFQDEKDVIKKMSSFQYIDEKGFNWGLSVNKLSERVLRLLENSSFLKEERVRARKLTRGIEGIGSFNPRSSSIDPSLEDFPSKAYNRCNSHYNNHQNEENIFFFKETQQSTGEKINSELKKKENPTRDHPFCDDHHHQLKKSLLSSLVE